MYQSGVCTCSCDYWSIKYMVVCQSVVTSISVWKLFENFSCICIVIELGVELLLTLFFKVTEAVNQLVGAWTCSVNFSSWLFLQIFSLNKIFSLARLIKHRFSRLCWKNGNHVSIVSLIWDWLCMYMWLILINDW